MVKKKLKGQNKKLPKKSKNSKSAKSAGTDWSLKRNVFFRPDRSPYILKQNLPAGCVFCFAAAEAESFETLCVHKTASSMIVLNKYPYNSGHLLILPREHCGNLLDFSDEQYDDLHQLLRLGMRAQRDLYKPAAANIGLNHGVAAGAGIPDHLHYHIVPRWAGDLNFFPLIAETKVVIENLEQTYQRYFEYFKSLKG